MTPKPVALGPTFPSGAPLKGAGGLKAPGGGFAQGFAEGFAHEVLSAIRAPARPRGKPEAEAPAELPWAVLLGTPADRPFLPSPRESPPARAGTRIESSELGNPSLRARPAEGRAAGAATRLLREVRQDWVALPMPETGPAPEVAWVHQEPGEPQALEAPAEATPEDEPSLEVLQAEVTAEPVLEARSSGPSPEVSVPGRTVSGQSAPELHAPAELLEPPELELLPPAIEREQVRIRLDAQLAVEITTRGRHVDVLISGSLPAVEPLKDLGPELGSQLMRDGYSLDDFQAHGEDPQEQPREEEDREQAPPARLARARRSARSGRYA
jgi:hypothetical protein